MSVSIVSGNGFSGHAQRADNEYGLENTSYYLTSALYDLSFQYRSSHAITTSLAGDLPAATGSAQTVNVISFTAEGANFQVLLNEVVRWYETPTTNLTIPTSHPTSKTITVSTGQPYHSGQHISLVNQYAQISTTVVSYNSGTGELVLNSSSSSGSGTYVSWVFGWGTFPPYGTATSSTSNTIPTSHPTQLTFTIQTGKTGLVAGTVVSVQATYVYLYGTVTAYNSGTGQLTFDSTSNSGTGSSSNWNAEIWEDYWWEIGTVNLTLS